MIHTAVCILILGAANLFASGAGSAISALQLVASQPVAGSAAFIELRGQRGEPLPPEWIILMADPSARGGVREISVSSGRIVAERTPLAGYTGITSRPALDRSKVSVDANSVFDIAQAEAVSSRLSFHWVDYTLSTNPATFQPEWTVRLFDSSGSMTGSLRIAAQGGAVIEPLVPAEGARVDSGSPKRVGGLVGKIVDFTESTAKKVENSTLRTIGNIQEFLVGERTVGPQDDE